MSAAQVAKHYGAYTLEEAMKLSSDEVDLLLTCVVMEREQLFHRVDKLLGTAISGEDVLEMINAASANAYRQKYKKDEDEEDKGLYKIPANTRIPLLMAIAPEFMNNFIEETKKKVQGSQNVYATAGTREVTSIGNLPVEQARDILRGLKIPDPEE